MILSLTSPLQNSKVLLSEVYDPVFCNVTSLCQQYTACLSPSNHFSAGNWTLLGISPQNIYVIYIDKENMTAIRKNSWVNRNYIMKKYFCYILIYLAAEQVGN